MHASAFFIGLFGCHVDSRAKLLRRETHGHTSRASDEARGRAMPADCATGGHSVQSSGAAALHELEFIDGGTLTHPRKPSGQWEDLQVAPEAAAPQA